MIWATYQANLQGAKISFTLQRKPEIMQLRSDYLELQIEEHPLCSFRMLMQMQ
jgi:hypothetical protein